MCYNISMPKGVYKHNKGRIPWNKGLTKDIDERLNKFAEKLKGKDSWMKGKKHTEEAKRKDSEAHKGNDYRIGKLHSDKTKEKMSESKKGKYDGEDNPMYGKKHTEETRKKISEAVKATNIKRKAKKLTEMENNIIIEKERNNG